LRIGRKGIPSTKIEVGAHARAAFSPGSRWHAECERIDDGDLQFRESVPSFQPFKLVQSRAPLPFYVCVE